MTSDDIREMHESFLYPIVRVFAAGGAGSGTIIYSEEDPKREGEYLTFILTNHHVVDELIEIKDRWNSMLKRKVKTEVADHAKIEVFQYVHTSTVDSSNRYSAEIVAHDKAHDLAVLRILSPRKFDHVASLIPRGDIENLRLFEDVVVGGCSLAHEPLCNFGKLTFLNELIDQKRYLMASAGMIFGNSGGALFHQDSGRLIGVPSRVVVKQMGFGFDVVTWMGFSAHPERIYEFLEDQEMQFLAGDVDDDYHAAMERRENRKRESMVELKMRALEDSGS